MLDEEYITFEFNKEQLKFIKNTAKIIYYINDITSLNKFNL